MIICANRKNVCFYINEIIVSSSILLKLVLLFYFISEAFARPLIFMEATDN